MGNTELVTKLRELKELKLLAYELENQITVIEDEVKAEMTARDTEEIVIDLFKVTWRRYNTTRFDTSSFKSAHKDIYDLFSKQVEARRFVLA